jgi:hypothetical protein
MAMSDYRWCNVCGCKAFYDAGLSYEYDEKPPAQNGQQLPDGCVADMACLCDDCVKTHEIVVRKRSEQP